jgi:DNA topoisomerase I
MSKTLVILESPNKCGKFREILGSDYIISASCGHIRNLDPKTLGIDIENNFEPNYVVESDKKAVIQKLKGEVKKCNKILLATDIDREGEAIAWHLMKVLKLDENKTRRIRFTEITKKAILKAVKEPGDIDINLSDAQQARRILDRLLGYKISPILWKQINSSYTKNKSLSAGRVQSVVNKMIIDRERQIEKFNKELVFKTPGTFKTKSGKYQLEGILDKQFKTDDEAHEFLENAKEASFMVSDVASRISVRKPSAPFTTSSLQQEASNKFRMSPKKTMLIAQKLYEAGLITYMRTDSTQLSEDAITQISEYITDEFGDEYLETREYKSKSKNAQEAHEAIRPTTIMMDKFNPHDDTFDADHKKLYCLIHNRTVASQMAAAKVQVITNTISMDNSKYKFITTGEKVEFDGFLRVYQETKDADEAEANDEENSDVKTNNTVKLKKGSQVFRTIISSQSKYTKPPHSHFTEASLVKELEKKGIGRPSTFSGMVSVVQTRGYCEMKSTEGELIKLPLLRLVEDTISKTEKETRVNAEKNKLFPTETGRIVNRFLEEQFPELLDYSLTANIEDSLDLVASNNQNWRQVVGDTYGIFTEKIQSFSQSSTRDSEKYTRELGEDSANGDQIKVYIGKYGPVIARTGENGTKYTPLKTEDIREITLENAIQLSQFPKIIGLYKSEEIHINVGKFGYYMRHNGKNYSIENNPDIQLEDAKKIIDGTFEKKSNVIKEFERGVKVMNGKYGPYLNFNKKNYKIPKGIKPEEITYKECQKIINK